MNPSPAVAPLRVLVVDDEPPARSRLRRMLEAMAGVEVAGEAASGMEALEKSRTLAPDVVLLDIRIPGMGGLEVARRLTDGEASPAVVFTTAYDRHALAAFEARALDYLLKPIRRERLDRALTRVAELRGRAGAGGVPLREPVLASRTHLGARIGGRVRLVPVDEVRYLRADRRYVEVGYPGGVLLVDEPLASLEEELGARFVRVHRNALVATRFVTALTRLPKGGYAVELDGVEETLHVSRRLVGVVKARLQLD